jgi:thioredoxin 1
MDGDFEDTVLNSEIPVLVDFWAEWCAPCKMIAPVLDELAEEFDGTVKFTKLDVDSNPTSTAKYGIRGIPAILIFKDGEPIDQIVGAVPKSTVKKRIESAIT